MTKVWVNGTFDIVHLGHIQMLKKAAGLGDFLIVGVDSDRRVKELKGEERPINKLISRITLLEAIKYVARVVSFDSDEELYNNSLIKHYVENNDDDEKNKKVIKCDNCEKFFTRLDSLKRHLLNSCKNKTNNQIINIDNSTNNNINYL